MLYIWKKIPKTKEGFVHYLPGDLPYLYYNGFVDTDQFSYEEWEAAFDSCKQADGSYLLDEEKFLSLRIYRYEGPLYEPFNPQKVYEGEWTDDDLGKFFKYTLKPSCAIDEEVFWNNVKAFKAQGFIKNGNLVVTKEVKTQLSYLVERFPSPRRRLEKEVNRLRQERETQYRSVTTNRDSSTFTVGKLASESKTQKFEKLQSKGPAPSTQGPTHEDDTGGIEIKKLRKPPRKITG